MRKEEGDGRRDYKTMGITRNHSESAIRLTIATEPATTSVILRRGALQSASELLVEYRGRRLLLVSDERVGPLYALPLCESLIADGYSVDLLTVQPGDESKTLETLEHLYADCNALQIDRGGVVVAVGGGVVGDLAGMLAGTYLRGLGLIQVPTSLVAMVSASVGGKVGVNFKGYKNMIGMFKHPSMVLADPVTLQTLPDVEFRSGLGELITLGVLGATEVFESLETSGIDQLDSLIAAAIICKINMVEADPFDLLGIRAKLNLGHTFGHALEKLSNFTLPHGIAVAVGLNIACHLAVELKLCPESLAGRVRRTLLALDLPTSLTGFQPIEVIDAMQKDKKRAGGRLRFVLPIAIGDVALIPEDQVPVTLLQEVLSSLVWESKA